MQMVSFCVPNDCYASERASFKWIFCRLDAFCIIYEPLHFKKQRTLSKERHHRCYCQRQFQKCYFPFLLFIVSTYHFDLNITFLLHEPIEYIYYKRPWKASPFLMNLWGNWFFLKWSFSSTVRQSIVLSNVK